MKRILLLVLCFAMFVLLSACGQVDLADEQTTPNPYEERIAELEQEIAEMQEDMSVNVEQDLQPGDVATPTPAPTPTPTVTPPPIDNPQMYSSYAYMVSFDPATGYAGFKYFQQLRGDEAVDALIRYEGYDEVDAAAEVRNWPEGGFYEKKGDGQLRTVDLSKVDVRLIISADGLIIDDIGNPPKASVQDVVAVFNANSKYLYNQFFYWITVNDQGTVTKVEQVYMP